MYLDVKITAGGRVPPVLAARDGCWFRGPGIEPPLGVEDPLGNRLEFLEPIDGRREQS